MTTRLLTPPAAAVAVLAAIVSLLAVAGPAAAAQTMGTPQTDETVAATKGARLVVDNFAGEVVVRAWDRDQVRVRARHSTRVRVRVRSGEGTVGISSTGTAGVQSVDYEISVPAWMPIKVAGTYNFVSIEGSQSEVTAESVRGDIVVKGGGGAVTVKSVEGEVTLEGVRGRINAQTTNEGITITGASGEIVAGTINGAVNLTQIDATSVEASTVNGQIRFEGSAAANGQYRFTTHNGSIAVAVPEQAGATFYVRTYNGRFNSALPVKGEGDVRRGRRVSFTLGNGSAEFVLESFDGTISLHKPGNLPPPRRSRGAH